MPHRVPAYRIQLVRDGSAMAVRKRCETAREAVEVFRSYVGDADREHFVAIYLDDKDRSLGLDLVAIRTINLAARYRPRSLQARHPLQHRAADRAAQPPSGEPAPSSEDLTLTRGLEFAGMLLGILLLDHVVVGNPG